MTLKSSAIILCLSFLIVSSGIGQEPQLLTKPGLLPELYGVLEKPETPGTHPAVMILYGSSGWRPAYVTMARDLADAGFVTLVLDYYAVGKREPDNSNFKELWQRWQAYLRNAFEWLSDDPSVDKNSIGVLGFSQGGYLAVSTVSSIPGVKAVVEFFGGAVDEMDLDAQVRDFPPLLILHGEKDEVVPVSKAYELRDAVLARGGEVEMKIYPGAPHGFNAPWIPVYSEEYDKDSFQRTVDFFRRKL